MRRRSRSRRRCGGSRPPAVVVVADEIEADRVDPHLLEHPDARGAGGEVEHGHEDGSPAQPVVLALWRPEHDDDVLAVAVVLVGDTTSGDSTL